MLMSCIFDAVCASLQIFDMELLRWEKQNDLAPEKDGSLLKARPQLAALGCLPCMREPTVHAALRSTACVVSSLRADTEQLQTMLAWPHIQATA